MLEGVLEAAYDVRKADHTVSVLLCYSNASHLDAELNDFYDSSAVPAVSPGPTTALMPSPSALLIVDGSYPTIQPHRLSQNLTPSGSYTDIPNQYQYAYSGSDPMTRPSIGGDNYRDSYASSFDKDAPGGYVIAGAGAGAGAGMAAEVDTAGLGRQGALGYGGYDPQGRSGARFAARQEQGATAAGAFGGGGAGYGYATDSAKSKKKWWWIIGGILLAVAAIVGIAVGVTVSRKSSNGGSGNSAAGGAVDVGDDPSVFEKDSRLHNSL